jgi:SAM-dependent methyltransferase
MRAEKAWKRLGATEPYFAVLSENQYLSAQEDGAARADFFMSGESHIAEVFADIHSIDSTFQPQRALDFGCGVGRLVIPLARRVHRVVGADISRAMISESARNVSEAGLTNVQLICTDEATLPGTFDFIHSYIVFQHIPVKTGLRITEHLISRLEPGGFGALHYTYGATHPIWKRALRWVRQRVPGVHFVSNAVQGHPLGRAFMQMNPYPMNVLFRLIQATGCSSINARFTNHGGFLGVILLFRKPQLTLPVSD